MTTSVAGSDLASPAPPFALAKRAAISSALSWRFGSLFVVSATASSAVGSDLASPAPPFALAKRAAISSALSWRFGSLFVVSATASSAAGLGSTTGSGASVTGSGSGT